MSITLLQTGSIRGTSKNLQCHCSGQQIQLTPRNRLMNSTPSDLQAAAILSMHISFRLCCKASLQVTALHYIHLYHTVTLYQSTLYAYVRFCSLQNTTCTIYAACFQTKSLRLHHTKHTYVPYVSHAWLFR
jgi:hypothetical protein